MDQEYYCEDIGEVVRVFEEQMGAIGARISVGSSGDCLRLRIITEQCILRRSHAAEECVRLSACMAYVREYRGLGYTAMPFPKEIVMSPYVQEGYRMLKQCCDGDRLLRTLARVCGRRSWFPYEELSDERAQHLCVQAQEGVVVLIPLTKIPLTVLRDVMMR